MMRLRYVNQMWMVAVAITIAAAEMAGPALADPPPGPGGVAGLRLWLSADAGVETTNDGAVVSWANRAPTGQDAQQAVPSYRPRWVSTELNGRPVVRFDGSDDRLVSGTESDYTFLHDGRGATSFAVCRSLATNPGTLQLVMNTAEPSSASYGIHFGIEDRPPSEDRLLLTIKRGVGGSLVAKTDRPEYDNTFPQGLWRLVVLTFEYGIPGSDLLIYTNGYLLADEETEHPPAAHASSRVLAIGAMDDGAYPLQGDVAEILLYDRVLSPAEIHDIGNALAEKYGLSAAYSDQPPGQPPGSLTAAAGGPLAIDVSWDAVGGADWYVIERDGTELTTTPGTHVQDSGLENGRTYAYRVAGANAAGIGVYAGPVQATADLSPPMQGPFAFSIPQYDWSSNTGRHVIIDAVPGQYMGQPDTVLMEDGQTILVGYPEGHGGPNTILRRSLDGGLTWSERLPTPASFIDDHNAPTLHRVVSPLDGRERLLLFVSHHDDPDPLKRVMKQAISEDQGDTWSELTPLFDLDLADTFGYRGFAPPKPCVWLTSGDYLLMYHDKRSGVIKLTQCFSHDGGLTWEDPIVVSDHPSLPHADPAEPEIIRSPNGHQLLSISRENARLYQSLVMTSDDEGLTWTPLVEGPASLTGDRHIARYTPDGRLLITFRDMSLLSNSPTRGDFVAWVGTYDDTLQGREGQYRIRLLDNLGSPGDTGYAGLELLPDGTFVSTTYAVLDGHGSSPVLVSMRFTMQELDSLAGVQAPWTDADGDGLPDRWELAYFGQTNVTHGGAEEDWDVDGLVDISEWVAQTDPTNAMSRFVAGTSSSYLPLSAVTFGTAAGRFYTVERTENLAGMEWQTLRRTITGTGIRHVLDPEHRPWHAYRVRVSTAGVPGGP